MAKSHLESGNQVVNQIFAKDSKLAESLQTDEVEENNKLYQFALMTKLAAGLHDSRYKTPDELVAGLNVAKMAEINPLIFEDQGTQDFGFDPSGLAFVLAQRQAGNGDAALKQVLDAPRLTKFDSNGPVLSAGKRLNRLTNSKSGSSPSLLQGMPKTGEMLTPLTLTRISRDVDLPIAAVLMKTLSPSLTRVSPNRALNVAQKLATIQLVADEVRPDIEAMAGAVADSQARQIGAFMGSIERAIDAAARNLQGLVGREIEDLRSSSRSVAANAMEGKLPNDSGRRALSGQTHERIVHRERPMAAGDVAVRVKPFNVHSRTTHFAASSAPIGSSKGQTAFHHSTDTGAFASASGPAVCASSATVVEANFSSDGFEIEINVRP